MAVAYVCKAVIRKAEVRGAAPVLATAILLLWAALAGSAIAAPQAPPTADKAPKPAGEKLFDPTAVQDIHLLMKESDWQRLREYYIESTYYPADMRWQDRTISQVGIRSRGSGSRNGAKPGIRIDFNRYVDQQFMRLKSIVLLNAIQDPSMVRQRLGMTVFARMGVAAPRVVHARLFVNGDYVGLYQLIEPIDKAMLGRVFYDSEAGKKDNDGYLYEYRWKDGYDWSYLGSDLRIYAELFDAKTHEQEAPSMLYGPLEDMFRDITEARDGEFAAMLNAHLDLSRFVTYLAVETFLSDIDGFLGDWGPNNFYLYRFDRQPASALIPWDKDSAFQGPRTDILKRLDRTLLSRRALARPDLYRTYLETLLACARTAMQPETPESTMGWLEAELAREVAQIRTAAYADPNKWYSNDRFEDELEKMLIFARERGPYVADEAQKALRRLSLAMR